MTGRRLYDHFVDSVVHANNHGYYMNQTDYVGATRRQTFSDDDTHAQPVRAWPFLTEHDRALWNELARRLTKGIRR